MKGLIIKDIYLLKNQLNFFLIVCAIGLLMMLTQGNSMFVISYSTFIFSMFTLSTISYDEFDNGSAFLFTLPIDKKMYVLEKYLFGFLVGAAAWIISTIVAVVYTVIKHPGTDMAEWVLTAVIFIFLPVIFLSLTLPVQLKFGAEKSRVAMFGVVGGIVIICFAIGYVLKLMDVDVANILTIFIAMGITKFIAIVAVVCIAVYWASYLISLKIMEKKQF